LCGYLFREIKRLRRQKRKLKERLVMKGDVYREVSELTRQEDLFRLGNIKSQSDLEEVERGEMEAASSSLLGAGDNEERESESLSESENEEETEGRILTIILSWVSVHGCLNMICDFCPHGCLPGM
jgi:hypothetical protein